MPPKNARKAAARRRAKKEEEGSEIEDELPPEAPPRPFKEIDSLPMSQDPPDYNILNQPLSIKDSAVLYSSLMKSRTGYTISNVFDMYWAKGKTKFDNDVNARDRMNKLCDCGMELGPHAYDVRFFILKDDEIEKKRESIKNKKKEKRMANKKAREEKKKIREMKKQAPAATENSQEPPATTTQTTPAPTATPAPSTTAPEPTSKSKPLPPLHNSSAQTSSSSQPQQSTTPAVPATSTQQQTQQQTQQPAPARTAPPPPPSNDMMQTPESQMMIANLNAIARVDPSLNALMKIVASGSASSAQIREFQGYIQRAKAMGPTAYFRQQYPNYQPTTQPVRPPKPPKKPKQPKEKQLTTFQEMYVSGADLVFEFSESPNVRFSLPKDAIVEKNEKGDFIVSFLVIYNDEKIKKWKARQQVKKEKAEKAKELEEKKKREQEEAENIKAEKVKAEETKQLEVRSSRRSSRAVKKKTEEEEAAEAEAEKKAAEAKAKAEELKKKKEKEKAQKDDDPEPIPYYMPFSFKITNVDDKYDPIFLNSFHKAEETYKMMEQVMKVGVRAPKYLLWYQVDAFDDENLAETLREQLYLIENPPKKRILK
ncbi:SWR1-complex protein 3 [Cyberlindnera fabianii]|uniref:SWR1-complex protein 3 n=1 Tax=Cyberlindnera fabianii TaxID=36022 RepID=A0A1V2L6B0_CYBFA|nr:SWR1-complex protein 3 [Cyberlindnera fabianii]